MISRERIGERIKRIRKGNDWTIEYLSSKSGVSAVTIGKIEGGGDCMLSTIHKLENVLENVLGVYLVDVFY